MKKKSTSVHHSSRVHVVECRTHLYKVSPMKLKGVDKKDVKEQDEDQ